MQEGQTDMLTVESAKKRELKRFSDVTYVYARMQDFSCADGAPTIIKEELERLERESTRSLEVYGHLRYGVNLAPWMAEYFFEFANCDLTGVPTGGKDAFKMRSANYNQVREE
ncbi:hypothetical protein GTE7_gp054 [Gordonia phage GTE7]|uniref:Uncharacterized protein n=2 Tax=Getseptimavirus TaxID=2560139 RepID=A0A0K0N6Y1_9CAUD|nr:hypothetical protein GTE7_gp054 [Gordonia phage GTE7]YP_009189192.1 hypothetical protein AU104_gp063 [Gordonia phage GMA7]AER26597.1 hypothetical protein [Gordonia phage GTE7]AKJ72492.1 hypothetical protein GMA7_55 [Gordonia phage GMA7]QSL99705.1 hypothetical protein SEA_AUSTIN_65 [Gordonia phage Austin]